MTQSTQHDADERMEQKMDQGAKDQARSRLAVLAEANYATGENFQRELDKHIEGVKVDTLNDEFDEKPDKQRLDETLGRWVSGDINTDIALTQLAQYRLSYRYGHVTPEVEAEVGHELLTSDQRKNLPFAKMVCDTCVNILCHAPDEVAAKHDDKHDSIYFQREFGIDPISRKNRGGNACNSHSP